MKIMLTLLVLISFQSISQVAAPDFKLPDVPYIPSVDTSVVLFINCDAKFPGGIVELKRHIRNYSFDSQWEDSVDSKRGYVSFVIEIDGSLTGIKVERGLSPELDDIMLRIIEEMPNWIPACDEYGPVRSRARMPITFVRPE